MKKVIYAVVLFTTIGLTSAFGQNEMTTMKDHSEHQAMKMTTFGVRGNCGMCKKTIEKAANSVDGVSKADWIKDKKMMMVSFDSSKTNEMMIQKAVAASGYDTEKIKGNGDAYANLPGCCKYDHTMEMNQGASEKSDNKMEHKH